MDSDSHGKEGSPSVSAGVALSPCKGEVFTWILELALNTAEKIDFWPESRIQIQNPVGFWNGT